MGFEKGHKKAGGKQKGYTAEPIKKAQELFTQTLEGEVPYIKDAFEKVRVKDPEKYLELFAKYAQYFIPKKTEVENNHNFDTPAIIDWGTK
jgi:hypothetical protein